MSQAIRLLSGSRRAGGAFFLSRHSAAATATAANLTRNCRRFSSSSAVPTDLNENDKSTTTTSDKRNKTKSKPAAYADLAKARLSALVVTTTAAGYVAAGPAALASPEVLAACLTGTFLCSSSAAAWNQIFEKDRDELMKRTQTRPLVTGDLTLRQAQTAAVAWGVGGTGVLLAGTDPVTASLGVANLALYAGWYTYLKPRSVYNTWVGAVVGAIPPVMGWTAAAAVAAGSTSGVDMMTLENAMPAVLLGSTLYFWQMPHFFALSYMYRTDYLRGGFQMLPHFSAEQTAAVMVRHAWYLSAVPVVACVSGATHPMFGLETLALNAYALHVVHKFQRERTHAHARKVFLTSLWYLPSWLMLFLLHSENWNQDEEKENSSVLSQYVSQSIQWMRGQGKEWCLHEQQAAAAGNDEDACPVTVGRRATLKTVKTASAVVAQQAQESAVAEEA